jgi:MFS family permease
VFPDYSLATIQTVILLPSLLVAVCGVISALLTRYNKISKKSSVLFGLAMLSLTGLLPIFFHTDFWQFVALNVIMGTGEGFLVPIAVSIMFDTFEEKERRFISGLQFSFVAGGCIFLSVVGGLLTRLIWYGGYILLLLAVVLIMAVYSVPNKKRQLPASKERLHAQKRTKLHKDVYYYSAMAFLFLLLYTVTNSNLSTHLAEANLGDAAVTGVANAVMMVGGISAGIGFGKLSSALKDHVITLSFLLIFIGFNAFKPPAGFSHRGFCRRLHHRHDHEHDRPAVHVRYFHARGRNELRDGNDAVFQHRARPGRIFILRLIYEPDDAARRGVHAVQISVCRIYFAGGCRFLLRQHAPPGKKIVFIRCG